MTEDAVQSTGVRFAAQSERQLSQGRGPQSAQAPPSDDSIRVRKDLVMSAERPQCQIPEWQTFEATIVSQWSPM